MSPELLRDYIVLESIGMGRPLNRPRPPSHTLTKMAVIRVVRPAPRRSVAFSNSLIRYINSVIARVRSLAARLLMTDEVKTVLGSW